jgi:hypothetical protein
MSIEDAANDLSERLRGKPWFTAVGIGEHNSEPCLFLYVKTIKKDEVLFLEDGWHNYHVEVRRSGTPKVYSSS